jgi:chloramphenicol O-acetyltransferase type A
VPQLRQRVRDDEVIEYDSLAVMTPVMTVEEGFRQVWCDNAPSSPPSAPRQRRRSSRQRDIAGAAHRRWRAFYLRQLSAVAPLHLDDPCGICRRRGGARAHLGKLQNGVIPVAGRFNHAFVDGLHASRFLPSSKRDLATPSGSGNR